jgi:dipeptidyl aminopeptidase/acylaminoacyl peptidase
MKNKKTNKNILYVVIFVAICLIGLSYYSNLSNTTSDKETTGESLQITDNVAENEKLSNLSYNGQILYYTITDNIYQIYSKSNTADQELIYTNKDDIEKIKFANSITNDNKLLAVMSDENTEFGGSLYLISLDKSNQKEKIFDVFATSQSPAISPGGEKIAYIVFSNAEREYGFGLYVINQNGENKVKIDLSPTGIKDIVFNSTGNKIIYTKEKQIMISDTDGTKQEKLYTVDTNYEIVSIARADNDIFLITLNSHQDNKSKIVKIDTQNNNHKIIFEINNLINDAHYASAEKDKLIYVENNQIIINNLNNNSHSIIEGSGILKWKK